MNLKDLKTATNEILANRDKYKGHLTGLKSINCFSAEKVEDDSGDIRYQVTIAKAAPDNQEFGQYVRSELDKMGYNDVFVLFEW